MGTGTPTGLFGPDVRPDEFHVFLEEVARVRDERRPNRRIVLLIDGLNEAAAAPEHNVLGLPQSPPDGVYFVVSQQPVDVPLSVTLREICRPPDRWALHLQDLRRYLENAVQGPGLAAALRAREVDSAHFVDALLHKSGGVWLYVSNVLREIERGERPVDDLDDLPFGLWQYYAQRCVLAARATASVGVDLTCRCSRC